MLRRVALVLAIASLGFGVVVWQTNLFRAAPAQSAAAAKTDAGGSISKLLYAKAATPPAPSAAAPAVLHGDPIVLPDCHLTVMEKQDVPSQRDGVLLVVGTEIAPGQTVPPELIVVVHIGGQEKHFRRLREGDLVQAGQLLAHLDDQLIRDDSAIKQAQLTSAKADLEAALKACEESKNKYETQRWLRSEGRGATSEEEMRTAKFAWDKASFDAIAKRQAVTLAERELNQTETVLRMHQIRSNVTGVVKTIYKQPGEAVHSYEPVVQVQQLTRLGVEGFVDAHQVARLRPGMPAIVEPAQPEGVQQTLVGHLDEITGVAVARDGRIVSASDDATVRVWDRATGGQLRVLHHSAAIRALACAAAATGPSLCLAGTADGKAYLWDLDRKGDTPLLELKGRHEGPITAVAFSPDGKTCATAGDDRDIRLWNVADGTLRYRFPEGHRAGVTSLEFTPRSQLVSVGRDNTLRLWTVGADGARLEATFDRRSGEVACLGVSPDGSRVLYDQGSTLQVLSLPEGLTEGVIQSLPRTTTFTTFARFAPNARLILTAGAGGRLQLWRAPAAGSRAAEIRQLVAADAGPATCAAFAPDGSCVAVGSRDRRVRVWAVPAAEEALPAAEITLVDRAVESSTCEARIRAELPNPDGRLLPGATVTLVIPMNEAGSAAHQ
jgi:multidrug efflux pump subunit AcrA (membrane-fusion protein)